jgi:hypothetical protein
LRRLTINGKPVRTLEWTKAVDDVVKRMQDTSEGRMKTLAELKADAEAYLAAGELERRPGLRLCQQPGILPCDDR